MHSKLLKQYIRDGHLDDIFIELYSEAKLSDARNRYLHTIEGFEKFYGREADLRLFSSPGRCEISGNHTDHQHGRVICASVDLDIISAVEKTENNTVHLRSEGYDKIDSIDLSDLRIRSGEREHSASLIRGIAAAFRNEGKEIGGFDCYTVSGVPAGSGISSSAAFELLLVSIFDGLYNDGQIAPVTRAKMAQFAENEYFGKPSGMLDQCGSAVGKIFALDFIDPVSPLPEQLDCDFSRYGLRVVLTKTDSDHADLTSEYAAVPNEMKAVAAEFSASVLAEVREEDFYARLKTLRKKLGDRPILRAMHFFEENARVPRQIDALKKGEMERFLREVEDSGFSSATRLQNIYVNSRPQEQALSVALSYAHSLLAGGKGVCRVHGGGFSGTILAIVREEFCDEYMRKMDALFGEASSYVLRVRPCGACELPVSAR